MATTTAEENKRIVRRLPEEVANAGNLDVLDEILAEDVIEHTPLGDLQGRDAAKDLFEQIFAAFPDRTVTLEDLIVEGDTVAVRVTWHATHKGPYMGTEPTGREVEFSVTGFHRLENGTIAESWTYPDHLGLMQQLGAVDPPTGAAE